MDGLTAMLFLLLVLTLAGAAGRDKSAIVFLAMLWLVAYLLTQAA
jgi:hypothetical protein